MNEMTHFAPALRSSKEEIIAENNFIASQKEFIEFFNLAIGVNAILDANRQVIYSNGELLKFFGVDSIEQILGKRPGEAVSCVHSGEEKYGCGTSKYCTYCGAVNAILESQLTGIKSSKETRISSIVDGKTRSIDIKITSIPVTLSGKQFYIINIEDISDV